ncbi:transporting ATPase [Vibrio sp. JCM 19236]|nr:transporting ATPase [Vibrio sp. JCM 19236]
MSCDNLHGSFEPDRLCFTAKVHAEVLKILQTGLPKRVEMLSNALRDFYNTPPLKAQDFKVV